MKNYEICAVKLQIIISIAVPLHPFFKPLPVYKTIWAFPSKSGFPLQSFL